MLKNNLFHHPLTMNHIFKWVALFILLIIYIKISSYPAINVLLFGLLAIYTILLHFYSSLWLVCLPALLPLLNFTPWSGQFFLNEFDLFILATVAIQLHKQYYCFKSLSNFFPSWNIQTSLFFLLITTLVSIFLAYTELHESLSLDFYPYLTPEISFYATKGFFYALLLLPIINYEKENNHNITRYFSYGMVIGLLVADFIILWEKAVYSGLLNFHDTYRVSGLFSEMRLGGFINDSFLFLTLPFIFNLFNYSTGKLVRVLLFVLFLITIYCILVTFTRTNYLVLIIILLLYFIGYVRLQKHGITPHIVIPLLSLAILISGITFLFENDSYISKRFIETQDSFKKRLQHWENTINLVNINLINLLFGNGPGVYPHYYLENNIYGKNLSRFTIKTEHDLISSQTFIRFKPGIHHNLKINQRIPVEKSGIYKIRIVLRNHSKNNQNLLIELCKKNLLPNNKRCSWTSIKITASSKSQWKEYTQSINVNVNVNEDNTTQFTLNSPVQISIINRGLHSDIDINSIRLYSPQGKQLIRNWAFNNNLDYWFFSTSHYRAWTVDNLVIAQFFSFGLSGCLFLFLILFLTLKYLLQTFSAGNPESLTFILSILSIIMTGTMGDPLNNSKISWLVYMILFLSYTLKTRPTKQSSFQKTLYSKKALLINSINKNYFLLKRQ